MVLPNPMPGSTRIASGAMPAATAARDARAEMRAHLAHDVDVLRV